jgi:glycosyltransferase involved in cell wall biosynthesis
MQVLPSRFEGFGIAAAEALAAGVPLIVSSTPALVEMVTPLGPGSEVGRVVPVDDTAALADAILYLLSRAGERARLSVAGRAAAERFRWGDVASRHREFLEHIAGPSLFPHAGSR